MVSGMRGSLRLGIGQAPLLPSCPTRTKFRTLPRQAAIAAETTARVVALTGAKPPHQATHCTGRAMAIWRGAQVTAASAAYLQHSRDPGFAAKLVDIVGLYVDPPAHAVVLSLDEKSQIQALDRASRVCRSSQAAARP
jgi:hypothetical protein